MGFWHSFDTVLAQFAPKAGQNGRARRGAVRGSDLESVEQKSRGVAQPGSAPALGAGGPRFKSARPDQISFSSLNFALAVLRLSPAAQFSAILSPAPSPSRTACPGIPDHALPRPTGAASPP